MHEKKGRVRGKTCAITGGSGFLGWALGNYLQTHGWTVIQLGRSKSNQEISERQDVMFSLGDDLDPAVFDGVDTLIHCAYDFSLTKWGDIYKINVDGTARLFRSAHLGGIRDILLVSSISAFPTAISLYGRAKYACEQLAKKYNGTSIRVGLVFDSESSGTIGAIESMIKSYPVIPIFAPGKLLYLCYRPDLCRCINDLLHDRHRADCITVANPQPLTFRELIQALQKKHNRIRPLIRLPWRAVWGLIRMVEHLGLKPPVRGDAMVNFVFQNDKPDFQSFKKLKLPVSNDMGDV